MTSSTSPRPVRTARRVRPAGVVARTAIVAGTAAVLVPVLATFAAADEPASTCQTVTADALGRDAGPVRVALGDSGLTVVRDRDKVAVEGGPVRSITTAYPDGRGYPASVAADGTLRTELAVASYATVQVCWEPVIVPALTVPALTVPALTVPALTVPVPVTQAQVQAVTPPPGVTDPEPQPPVVDRATVAPGSVGPQPVRVDTDEVVPTDPTTDPVQTGAPVIAIQPTATPDPTGAPSLTSAATTAARAAAPTSAATPAPTATVVVPRAAAVDKARLAVTGASAGPVVVLAAVLAAAGTALVALRASARRRARR